MEQIDRCLRNTMACVVLLAVVGGAGTFVDEGFEGPGYVETWTETNGTGRINDDATSPAPPAGMGSYCLLFNKNDATTSVTTTLTNGTNNTSIYVRAFVRIDSTNLANGSTADFMGISGYSPYPSLGVLLANVSNSFRYILMVRTEIWTWTAIDTSPSVSLDTWYRLELYANTESRYLEARLDDIEFCNNHTISGWYDGSLHTYTIGFADYPSALRLTAQVDGFAVSDSTWLGSTVPDTVDVLHIGDSQLSGEPSGSDSLQIQFGGYHVPAYTTYAKRGIGGQTSGQIRSRLVADMLAYNPAIVVYDGGANDWSYWHGGTWTWPRMMDTIIANLSWMDSTIRARDAVPVYLPLPPAEADSRAQYYKRMNVRLRKWARELGTAWAAWWYELVHTPALDEFAHAWEAADQTHPSPEGSSRIGMMAAGALVERGTIYADSFGCRTYPNPASHSWRNWSLGAGVDIVGNSDTGSVVGTGYCYSPVYATEDYDSTRGKRVALRLSATGVDSVAYRVSSNNFSYDTTMAWVTSRYPARDSVTGRYCQYRLYLSADSIRHAVCELGWMHVDSVRPARGTTGDTVRLYGFGFASGDSVLFGDSAATILSLNDSVVVAIAPTRASGAVAVVLADADDLNDTLPNGWRWTSTTRTAPSASKLNLTFDLAH